MGLTDLLEWICVAVFFICSVPNFITVFLSYCKHLLEVKGVRKGCGKPAL